MATDVGPAGWHDSGLGSGDGGASDLLGRTDVWADDGADSLACRSTGGDQRLGGSSDADVRASVFEPSSSAGQIRAGWIVCGLRGEVDDVHREMSSLSEYVFELQASLGHRK